jgi:hypothetical protein
MEYAQNQHVSEDRMDRGYLQKESGFREQAAKFWTEESAIRERIRSNVDLTAEERQDAYRESYEGLERRFDELVGEFGSDISHDVFEATQVLNRGTGSSFAEHLTRVSGMPDEKLAEIMSTARRSSQPDLERAVAQVAFERGVRPVWQSWAEANPERAKAVKLLRGVPGIEQLHTRTARAMRPPRAGEADLEATAADLREAQKAAEAAEAARQAFFRARASLPRRQVGSRIS